MNAVAKKTIFDFPLSPAQQALEEHLDAVAKVSNAYDEASAPVIRLREQVSLATARRTEAQARVASLAAEQTSALLEAAKSGTPINLTNSKAAAAAEVAVETACRAVDSLTVALNEAEAELATYRVDAPALSRRTDELVLAFVVEMHAKAIEDRELLRLEFVAAEEKLLGLTDAIVRRGRALHQSGSDRGIDWLRAGTGAQSAFGKTQRPEPSLKEVNSTTQCALEMFKRLYSDATASW